MKQKDIALIIVVVAISGVASFFLSGMIFKTTNLVEQVETVDAISAEFPEPNPKFFNPDAINPTQLIRIGGDSNDQPFKD